MISPIKFNNSKMPKFMLSFLPNEYDARNLFKRDKLSASEFSNYIQAINFGGKFSKTTKPNRHILSDEIIQKELSNYRNAVILDVGASDGSTSVDLIRKINGNFDTYYVTDVSFSLHFIENNGKGYFYDSMTKECIMIVTDYLIIYHDTLSSSPIGSIARHFIRKAPRYDPTKIKIVDLCQPKLKQILKTDKRVNLLEWSIMEPWKEKKADIIKVANVLKTEVFSEDEIRTALKNLLEILKPNGKLLITRNLDKEKYSLFRKNGTELKLESEINGGCDITYLIEESA